MSNGQASWPVTPRRIAARNNVCGRRLQRIWLGANLCVSLFSSYAYSQEVLLREGRLTFANAANAGEKMKALVVEYNPQVVVLECSAIPDIEYTALLMLIEGEQNLRARGIGLWLAAVNPDLLQVIERSPLGAALGHERMFFDLHKALDAYSR